MEAEGDFVRSMVIPLEGSDLLVASAVVAEVLSHPDVAAEPGAPDWLLGRAYWRGVRVPLVSMERARGVAELSGDAEKVVVFYALSQNNNMRYYAVCARDVPRPLLSTHAKVQMVGDRTEIGDFVAAQVRIEGEAAFIPDLDALEDAIAAAMAVGESFAQENTEVKISDDDYVQDADEFAREQQAARLVERLIDLEGR